MFKFPTFNIYNEYLQNKFKNIYCSVKQCYLTLIRNNTVLMTKSSVLQQNKLTN